MTSRVWSSSSRRPDATAPCMYTHSRVTIRQQSPTHRILPPFPRSRAEPPVGRADPPLRRHTVARSTDTSRSAATERALFFPSSRRRLTGDGTRTQTHEMTRARDLAQLSGHSETDCEEVLAQCHGDVDRAIDRLLNSA